MQAELAWREPGCRPLQGAAAGDPQAERQGCGECHEQVDGKDMSEACDSFLTGSGVQEEGIRQLPGRRVRFGKGWGLEGRCQGWMEEAIRRMRVDPVLDLGSGRCPSMPGHDLQEGDWG